MSTIAFISVSLIYMLTILYFSSTRLSKIGTEFSRKFAHVAISLWWFFGNYFAPNSWAAYWVAIIMAIFMIIAYRFHLINGIERSGEVQSFGCVYYFIGMLILLILSYRLYGSMIPLGIFFMPLGFGDAAAALSGKYFHWKTYTIIHASKSISGNIAMFVVSFISMLMYLTIYNLDYTIMNLLWISLAATILEAVSIKGTDNFTIPLGSFLLSLLF